jgi:hypothetical protein
VVGEVDVADVGNIKDLRKVREQTGPLGAQKHFSALPHHQRQGRAAYRRGEMLAKRHKLMAEWEAFCDAEGSAERIIAHLCFIKLSIEIQTHV